MIFAVLFKIRLFAFAFPFPVPSVFLFIVPTEQFKACWPTRFYPMLSKEPQRLMSMSLCLLFQGHTCFLLFFYFGFLPIFFIFIYFTLSIFLIPVFCLPSVAFAKGDLCSLLDYRDRVCHSLGLTNRFFRISFPSCISMAERRFLI